MAAKSAGKSIRAPRVLVAGLRGSGGKTLVSLGLTGAFRETGLAVMPFKKGADYIDAAWLSAAAGATCRNLDLYMVSHDRVLNSFVSAAPAGDVSVIEGNRGLYDGMNVEGSYSSAEVAKLIKSPHAFRILERLNTQPKVYYLSSKDWVRKIADNPIDEFTPVSHSD